MDKVKLGRRDWKVNASVASVCAVSPASHRQRLQALLVDVHDGGSSESRGLLPRSSALDGRNHALVSTIVI
jgi:hypothetical protein